MNFLFCKLKINLPTCFMIAHIFKDKHKVVGDLNSLNLLVSNESEKLVTLTIPNHCFWTHQRNVRCYSILLEDRINILTYTFVIEFGTSQLYGHYDL